MISIRPNTIVTSQIIDIVNAFNNSDENISIENLTLLFKEVLKHKSEIEVNSSEGVLIKIAESHPADNKKKEIYTLGIKLLLANSLPESEIQSFIDQYIFDQYISNTTNPGAFASNVQHFHAIINLLPKNQRSIESFTALKTLFNISLLPDLLEGRQLLKVVLEAIGKTPEAKRSELIVSIETLQLGKLFEDPINQEALEKVKGERLAIMRTLSDVPFPYRRAQLIEEVALFPPESQELAAQSLKELFKQVYMGPEMSLLRDELILIPTEQRLKIIENTLPQLTGEPKKAHEIGNYLRENYLKTTMELQFKDHLERFSIEDQPKIIDLLALFPNESNVEDYLTALLVIPSKFWSQDLVVNLLKLFDQMTFPEDFKTVIEDFKYIPKEEWANPKFLWCFADRTSFETMSIIPPELKWNYIKLKSELSGNDLVHDAINLILNQASKDDLPEILRSLPSYFSNQNEAQQVTIIELLELQPSLIIKAMPLVDAIIFSDPRIEKVAHTLYLITEGQLEPILPYINSVLPKIKQEHIKDLIYACIPLLEEEREEFLEKMVNIYSQLTPNQQDNFLDFLDVADSSQYFQIINNLHGSEDLLKGDIIINLFNRFKDIQVATYENIKTTFHDDKADPLYLLNFSKTLLKIKDSLQLENDHTFIQQAEDIQLPALFLNDTQTDQEKLNVISSLTTIPIEVRRKAIKDLRELFLSIDADEDQKNTVLGSITWLSSDSVLPFIDYLKAKQDWTSHGGLLLLQMFFQEYPHLAEASHKVLFETLESSVDAEWTQGIAQIIWDNQASFCIHEEHYLAQQALNKLIQTEDLENPKNPYKIYQHLQDWNKEIVVSVPLPTQFIAGKQVTFDREEFQNKMRSKKNLTFAQLPKNVGPDTIHKLFDALSARVAALDKTKRDETLRYIEDVNEEGASLEKLKDNFVKDIFLQSLLMTKGKYDDEAPSDVVRFYSLMKLIEDMPNELKEDELLTPREDMLLKISNSIQFCNTGKSEGISQAYHYFNKYVDATATLPAAEKAEAYVFDVVQAALNDAFGSETEMMRELIGIQPTELVEQGVHQSLYAKNLMGPRVGLNHKITFDSHTHTLYDQLIEKTPLDAMTIFYKHFNPQRLIDALRVRFNVDKNTVRDLFNNVEALLGPKVDRKSIYDADEDYLVFSLNETGAQNILVALGYFKYEEKQSIQINK